MPNLRPRPLLSICISTYNRSRWLEISLHTLFSMLGAGDLARVEVVVCDNASTDDTPRTVEPYLHRADFRYLRNARNVGMLGNLAVTANAAEGDYIWILGDDDILRPGAVEKVLRAIDEYRGVALVYLNYCYTHRAPPERLDQVREFVEDSTPIVTPSADAVGSVRELCTRSENFFTAIYCLVFRRDHATRAYSQDTAGRPFSTLLTCVPTTWHVLHHMMGERAVWIGTPQVVVNMNVSWLKYASLWVLERVPEFHDLAERLGAESSAVDRWRAATLSGLVRYFGEIFEDDPEGNASYVSIGRVLNRYKHLDAFHPVVPLLRSIYDRAHAAGHPLAEAEPTQMFAAFDSE